MGRLPGEKWQWVTALAALVICFSVGVHCGRYLEREPETPTYSTTPGEAVIHLVATSQNDSWAEGQERAILAALKKKISIELEDTPFDDFVDYLQAEIGANCHTPPGIEHELRMGGCYRIRCKLSDVPLQTLLDTVLVERKLCSHIHGGVLMIVTCETAAEMLETRVYPVRDLGQAPRFRGPNVPVDPIIEVIQNSVDPSSWTSNGGPGSIERFPNADSLIITQSSAVHERIAVLLAQVRKSRQLQRP
jgi:hypothetical protein